MSQNPIPFFSGRVDFIFTIQSSVFKVFTARLCGFELALSILTETEIALCFLKDTIVSVNFKGQLKVRHCGILADS